MNNIFKMQMSNSFQLINYTNCYAIIKTVFKENILLHEVNKSYNDYPKRSITITILSPYYPAK